MVVVSVARNTQTIKSIQLFSIDRCVAASLQVRCRTEFSQMWTLKVNPGRSRSCMATVKTPISDFRVRTIDDNIVLQHNRTTFHYSKGCTQNRVLSSLFLLVIKKLSRQYRLHCTFFVSVNFSRAFLLTLGKTAPTWTRSVCPSVGTLVTLKSLFLSTFQAVCPMVLRTQNALKSLFPPRHLL